MKRVLTLVVLPALLAGTVLPSLTAAQAVTNRTGTAVRMTMPTAAARRAAELTTVNVRFTNRAGAATLPASTLGVFVKEGAEWKRQATSVTGTAQEVRAGVPKGSAAILTTPATNRMTLDRKARPLVFWLPTAADQTESFEVEAYADPEPARWNREKGQFEADVNLAIFRPNRNARAALPSSVTVNLAGREAEVDPKELTFTEVATYRKARVTFVRNDVEARLNVFPFTEEAPFVVPVRRFGGVKAHVTPASVLGYGLGVADLTIRRIGTNQAELSEGPALDLTVEPGVARTSSTITIPAGVARSQTTVRSVGTGRDRIRVSVDGYSSEVEVEYRAPWLFLVAVLLGGLVGGCARFLQKRQQKNIPWGRYLAEGCVAGVLATAAVLAGVAFSLLPVGVAETELGAFLISAAVALVGISAISGLKQLVPKVRT